jgi:hypothetical protein
MLSDEGLAANANVDADVGGLTFRVLPAIEPS